MDFEIQDKKGLCFRCAERYFHGHKCKKKEERELNLLTVHDEDETEELEVKETEEEEAEMKVMEVTNNMEIALHSILGFSTE